MVKKTIYGQFCGGESLKECQRIVKFLADYGIASLLDYAVEGHENTAGLDETCKSILESAEFAGESKTVPYVVFKPSALFLSEDLKGPALSDTDDYFRGPFAKGMRRVESIIERAASSQLGVLIDAEQSWLQDRIDGMALGLMRRYNREGRVLVLNTVQTYRCDRDAYLKEILDRAIAEGFGVGIKLVRGAYLETERLLADKEGRPSPIWASKTLTDACFDRSAELLLNNLERVRVVFGTHNEKSVEKIVEWMGKLSIAPQDTKVTFSQLYGMSENLSFVLAKSGYRVAKYVPYGPVEATLPYLSRRAQENSSVRGQTSRELSLISKELKRRRAKS